MKRSTQQVYRERILSVLEFYLNTPESTDPQDLITDIYAPLEPVQ